MQRSGRPLEKGSECERGWSCQISSDVILKVRSFFGRSAGTAAMGSVTVIWSAVCSLVIPQSIAGFRSTRRRSKRGCAGSGVARALLQIPQRTTGTQGCRAAESSVAKFRHGRRDTARDISREVEDRRKITPKRIISWLATVRHSLRRRRVPRYPPGPFPLFRESRQRQAMHQGNTWRCTRGKPPRCRWPT